MISKKNGPDVRLGILESTIGYLLRRAYRRFRNLVLPELEKFGFKEVEISALVIITENPNCSLSDIAAAVAVDLPVAHRYVARLQKLGCVTMVKSKQDRRVATFKATSEGARTLRKMGELVQKADSVLYDQLSPEEKRFLSDR